MARRSVAYIYPFAFHYRNAFHEGLRGRLAREKIDYDFIYCPDPHFDSPRGDLVAPEWATPVRCSSLKVGATRLRYQHVLRAALGYDLIILQQENALLANHALQFLAPVLGRKVAFFGHGRNFQATNPESLSERFKRLLITRVDWWFAYTQRSADIVMNHGFPSDRVTVFNNAIDTDAITAQIGSLDPNRQADLRRSLVGGSMNVGAYVGGLYPDKRIGFLIEAAQRIRTQLPDFHLLVIGGGQDAAVAEAAAGQFPWVHYLGPKFGREKTELVALASVMMIPGLVGLAILDSFAYGTPLVTTQFPRHSPEIDYLEHGVNGLVTADNIDEYAAAVVGVLRDDELQTRLRMGGAEGRARYTISAMVERFAQGVMKALARD